jgi:hypothetical protein
VVDDQVHRRLGINFFGIDPSLHERVAHGGQVDYGGYAGKVLHQNACRMIGDFLRAAASRAGG